MIANAPTLETATRIVQFGYGPLIAAEVGTFNRTDHEAIAQLLISEGHATAVAQYLGSFELEHPVEILETIIDQRKPDALAMIVEQFGSYTVPQGDRPAQLKPKEAREIGKLLFTRIDELYDKLENRSYEPRLGDVIALKARVQGVLERLSR